MRSDILQKAFFNQLDATHGIALLFDYLPEIYLFVKNRHSQFVKLNASMQGLMGIAHEREALGKTDLDFFLPEIGQKYIDEDRQVMAQGHPFVNRIWLVPNSDGKLIWYLCTKIPLRNRSGNIVGIAGTLRNYHMAGPVLEPYQEMSTVLEHITQYHAQPMRVADLAGLVHLSVSQFERRFKQLFHVSPIRYINKVRLHVACQRLTQTNTSITQIAHSVGFYDHSYFTKQFTKQIGLTPREYRRQYHRCR